MAATTHKARTPSLDRPAETNGATLATAHADWRNAGYQAFALRVALTIAPIAFWIDTFFTIMVDWPVYLARGSTTSRPRRAGAHVLRRSREIFAGLVVAQVPLRRLSRCRLAPAGSSSSS